MERIWRVFNGWTGNGAIHRIVVADTKEQAEAMALAVWQRERPGVVFKNLEAVAVETFDGVEGDRSRTYDQNQRGRNDLRGP
jgi:hypothetical protein